MELVLRAPRSRDYVHEKDEIEARMEYFDRRCSRWRNFHAALTLVLLIAAPLVALYAPRPLAVVLIPCLLFLAFRVGLYVGSDMVTEVHCRYDLEKIYDKQLKEDELVPLNHVLYRLYNENDDLLYVGITSDVVARMAGHRGDKWWWSEVSKKKFEYLETRAELEAAERLAIIREKPLYNIVHHPDRPPTTYIRQPKQRKHTATGSRR